MSRFVRRSQIVISGQFFAPDWSDGSVVDDDDDDGEDDIITPITQAVTATQASPCVFTWGTPLPFEDGAQVTLTGAPVPGGFTAGATYFVIASNPTTGTFNLSATLGGQPVNSTSTGTGVMATVQPEEQPLPGIPSVVCQLHYFNMLDQETITSISMAQDSTNRWSGTWDSTDAKPGRVEWVVYSTGAVAAAAQGSFELFGNSANIGDISKIAQFAADDAAGINQG